MSLLSTLDFDDLRPSQVWACLDPATRETAARALYGSRRPEIGGRREADLAIAAAIRFREVAVRKLSAERRVGYLLRSVRPDDGLASSLLLALHLEDRSELLATFLDALGIPHEGGMIDDDHDPGSLDRKRLEPAVARLLQDHPTDRAELYLVSLLALDDDTWGALRDILSERSERAGGD